VSDQQEIEQSIREEFPILFLHADTLDPEQYLEKRNQLIDYGVTVSQPFLSAETVRYQSILLYASLIFLSVSLLQIGKLKIGDELVAVDKRLALFYEVFLGAVALIFLMKAYIDFGRAQLGRAKNDHVLSQFINFLAIARLRKQLQQHFWGEIFDKIGVCYQAYTDAQAKARNRPSDHKHISVNVLSLKIDELRKLSELRPAIVAHETFLATLTAQLMKDESRFNDRVDRAFQLAAKSEANDSFDCYTQRRSAAGQVQAAYEETLKPWIEARNTLSNEQLKSELKDSTDLARLDHQLVLVQRIVRLRQLYAAIEIGTPILFALVVIFYVHFSLRLEQTGLGGGAMPTS